MATIKGQHLRLFLDGNCIAAAQSCNVHVAVNMQEASSKDDVGTFSKQVPVGLSWDVKADALVLDSNEATEWEQASRPYSVEEVTLKDSTTADFAVAGNKIYLAPGECLIAYNPTGWGKVAIINDEDQLLNIAGSEGAAVVYWNHSASTMLVYVGNNYEDFDEEIMYRKSSSQLSALMDMMIAKRPIEVHFAQATGTNNREIGDWDGYYGMAVITDINVNAANRAIPTYSVSLVGTADLETLMD